MIIDQKVYFTLFALAGLFWVPALVSLALARPGSGNFQRHVRRTGWLMAIGFTIAGITGFLNVLDYVWA